MAFLSVDPWYYEVEIIDTRPKIQCVLPVMDDDIYSLLRVSSVTVHQKFCMRKNFSSSLYYISCPGVTMKDSDYQNGSPMCEEQHNHFLYLCNTNNPNQRNLKSLLFSDFLWFSFTLFAFKCDMIFNGFDN